MPEIGDLIGPYRLVSPLGKGAMGEVWRARDERLDRHVALKVMPPEIDRDVERRSRMLREAKAAAAIRHANVVTLFDVVKHAGDDILVMELVEGRTLSEALRKDGAPSLETGLRWIAAIADALVAAHARGILHRDIKAANVMVATDGGIKVLDFGLAKLSDDTPHLDSLVPRPRSRPAPNEKIALDATMPSSSGAMPVALDATMPSATTTAPAKPHGAAVTAEDIASYQTHAGQLIGTPVYMAPEQIDGAAPDERSEVFSLGVLAHEILAGKPPYTAQTMDALFVQILNDEPPPIDAVPAQVTAILARALAKQPADRFPSMAALRDAVAAERARLFAPRVKKWPWIAAAVGALAIGGIVTWRVIATRPPEPPPIHPGDKYVTRALEQYDAFENDQMTGSLHSALAIAPDHPLANAYIILFGYASDVERTRALDAARRALAKLDPKDSTTPKTRALLQAAVTLVARGPVAAIAAMNAVGAPTDRELVFWAAELQYRAGNYTAAHDGYKAMLAEPAQSFRGRIYDHYTSVLIYLDEPGEAEKIGAAYKDAMPAEADALGVYATTLLANGKLTEAADMSVQASMLRTDEDTLAGEAKVAALAGDRKRAEEIYARSIAMPNADRRPMRRAALGLLQWMDGDDAAAKATTQPCLPGGDDADNARRAGCLFVGAIIDPSRADAAVAELGKIEGTYTPTHPPYGSPASLAALIRARQQFFGGGCVKVVTEGKPDASLEAAYAMPIDFYASYHIPFFQTFAVCEHAALLHALGRDAEARALLTPVAQRAPNRTWLTQTLARYSGS